jgi:hypothetical protein
LDGAGALWFFLRFPPTSVRASAAYALVMPSRRSTSPTRAKTGDAPTSSVPAPSDIGENSASELIEAPQKGARDPLDPHDFADGGGSGGAERFSRARLKKTLRKR